MGAKFNEHDKHWLMAIPKDNKLNALEKELLFITFDTETSADENQIHVYMKEFKHFKRFARIKLFITPLEIPFFVLTFRLEHLKNKIKLVKLYWRFTFNKISFEDFKLEWNKICADGIII